MPLILIFFFYCILCQFGQVLEGKRCLKMLILLKVHSSYRKQKVNSSTLHCGIHSPVKALLYTEHFSIFSTVGKKKSHMHSIHTTYRRNSKSRKLLCYYEHNHVFTCKRSSKFICHTANFIRYSGTPLSSHEKLHFTSCPIYSMQQPSKCRQPVLQKKSWMFPFIGAFQFPATPHMQKPNSISCPKPCFKAVRVSLISSKSLSNDPTEK